MWIQNGRGERVGSCPSTLFLVYGDIPGDEFAYHLVFVLFGSQLCPCLFPTTKHLPICPLHVSCLGHSTVRKKHYCSGHPRTLETSMRLPLACLSYHPDMPSFLMPSWLRDFWSLPTPWKWSSRPFCSWLSNPIWRFHHSASTDSLLPLTPFRWKVPVVSKTKLSNIIAR